MKHVIFTGDLSERIEQYPFAEVTQSRFHEDGKDCSNGFGGSGLCGG